MGRAGREKNEEIARIKLDRFDGYCLSCSYRLRGLSEPRCPECGRTFDFDDPRSISRVAPGAWIVRQLGKPVGRPMRLVATTLVLTALISVFPPGAYFLLLMTVVLGWEVLGGFWVIRLILFLVVHFLREGAVPHRYRSVRPWLWPPILGVLSAGVVYLGSENNGRVGFHLMRPWLDWFAVEAMQQPEDGVLPDRWIGVYRANDIERYAGGVRFIVSGAGLFDRVGLAYSEQGEPPRIKEDYYYSIDGRWYIWRESW